MEEDRWLGAPEEDCIDDRWLVHAEGQAARRGKCTIEADPP